MFMIQIPAETMASSKHHVVSREVKCIWATWLSILRVWHISAHTFGTSFTQTLWVQSCHSFQKWHPSCRFYTPSSFVHQSRVNASQSPKSRTFQVQLRLERLGAFYSTNHGKYVESPPSRKISLCNSSAVISMLSQNHRYFLRSETADWWKKCDWSCLKHTSILWVFVSISILVTSFSFMLRSYWWGKAVLEKLRDESNIAFPCFSDGLSRWNRRIHDLRRPDQPRTARWRERFFTSKKKTYAANVSKMFKADIMWKTTARSFPPGSTMCCPQQHANL